MKLDESRELISARKLLSLFEAEMALPSAKSRLSEALSVLAEIVETEGAEGQIARNLASVYGAKAAAASAALLEGPVQASPAELDHWEDLLSEFARSVFESAPVVAMSSKFNQRLVSRHVAQMTKSEKDELVRLLEADLGKEHA